METFKEILKKETFKKYSIVFCFILILCLVLELAVFNFRSFESLFNKEITNFSYTVLNAEDKGNGVYIFGGSSAEKDDDTYKMKTSSVARNSDGYYDVVSADKKDKVVTQEATKISNGVYQVSNSIACIEINNLNQKLNNIKLDITRSIDKGYSDVRLWAVDEANAQGIYAPTRENVNEWSPTDYIRTHFSGEVSTLKIFVTAYPGEKVVIEDFRINCRVPIYFSIARFLFMVFALMFLFVFRPKSFIYKINVDLKRIWQKCVLILLLIFQILFFFGLCHINEPFLEPHWEAHDQYQVLAKSFLKGHTYLDKKPSDKLLKMENPYDTSLRSKLGVDYKWDHAFRNGKYYVYFGVVPELVYFLPYYMLTGKDFPNYMGVFISCALICIGIMLLLYQVIKKWFKNTSLGVYLLTGIIMINTCGVLYMAKRPDFYSIPIAMAVMFAIFGLMFWLMAEIKLEDGTVQLKARYLLIGSLCMALVAGCRPHILLTTFFGIILFWKAVFKDRILFSKTSIKQTIAVCVPYIVVGVGIMIYNYVRFDSPFDFGANYNLTTNDMTQRSFVMDRNLTGLFHYLFQPLHVTNQFPYVQMINVESLYQGLTLSEKMMGGIIWGTPIIFFGMRGLVKRKWYERDIRPYIISCSTLFIGAIVAMLDAQLAGILSRYYSDFSWILLLGSVIAVYAEYNYIDNDSEKHRLTSILIICLLISTAVFGLNILNDVDNSVKYNNPWLFFMMKYMIGFLL